MRIQLEFSGSDDESDDEDVVSTGFFVRLLRHCRIRFGFGGDIELFFFFLRAAICLTLAFFRYRLRIERSPLVFRRWMAAGSAYSSWLDDWMSSLWLDELAVDDEDVDTCASDDFSSSDDDERIS